MIAIQKHGRRVFLFSLFIKPENLAIIIWLTAMHRWLNG